MDHLFVPSFQQNDTSIEITDDLRSHVAALRLRNGDETLIFNGKGLIARCELRVDGASVEIRVKRMDSVEKPLPLVLAMGCLDHRDRFEFAFEKVVELGVTTFIPLSTNRVQRAKVSADRLDKKARAALTQSGQAWMPDIYDIVPLDAVLRGIPEDYEILVGEQHGEPHPNLPSDKPVAILVGPEGGFTNEELEVLRSDPRVRSIAIGRHRLRAETAAIALVSLVTAMRS
jgi:16S rRNA (uracil1498-N3)-methyltransferase